MLLGQENPRMRNWGLLVAALAVGCSGEGPDGGALANGAGGALAMESGGAPAASGGAQDAAVGYAGGSGGSASAAGGAGSGGASAGGATSIATGGVGGEAAGGAAGGAVGGAAGSGGASLGGSGGQWDASPSGGSAGQNGAGGAKVDCSYNDKLFACNGQCLPCFGDSTGAATKCCCTALGPKDWSLSKATWSNLCSSPQYATGDAHDRCVAIGAEACVSY